MTPPRWFAPPTKRMLGGSLGRPTNSFWSALPPFPELWTAHQLPTCLLSMKSNSLLDPFPVCRYHGNNIPPAAGTVSHNPLPFLFSAEDGLWKPVDLCPQRIHLFVCPFPTLPFFRSPFPLFSPSIVPKNLASGEVFDRLRQQETRGNAPGLLLSVAKERYTGEIMRL